MTATASATVDHPRPTARTDRPLVIAHVTNYFMPGFGYQENHLPFAQASLGHRVHIVTSDRPVPDSRFSSLLAAGDAGAFEPGGSTDRGVTIHRLRTSFEIRRRNNLLLRGLGPALNAIAPDVLHLHGVTPLVTLAAIMARPPGSTLVVDHHLCRFNLRPWTPTKRAWYWGWRKLIVPLLEKRVQMWLPINDDAREVLVQVLGISGDKVRVNRLGADIRHFRWDPMIRRLGRKDFGFGPQSRVFVHCGRLGARKEVDVLLQAFSEMAAPSDVLVVAGDAAQPYRDEMCALAAGARGEVRFLPLQSADELVTLFNAADAAVWPGDGSITLIQALACGLPPLIADDPGPDYVAYCPDARVFNRGDTAALAGLMAGVAGGENDEYEARRSRVAAFCRENLGWSAIAAQSIGIYREAGAMPRAVAGSSG